MKIVYSRSAEKELLRLQKSLAIRIHKKIEKLTDDPFGFGAKKLSGSVDYRIRVGDYRVVYRVDTLNKIIIIKIAHRRDVYK